MLTSNITLFKKEVAMIFLKVVPGEYGRLYPKPGVEGDVILQFDPKRVESFLEEHYHVVLGHHHKFGKEIFTYKKRWELEREVTELKLRIGAVTKDEAIICLYNVRWGLINEADEEMQIDGKDRECLSEPYFLNQVAEVTGLSQDYIKKHIKEEMEKA